MTLVDSNNQPKISLFYGENIQMKISNGQPLEVVIESDVESWNHICLVVDSDATNKASIYINRLIKVFPNVNDVSLRAAMSSATCVYLGQIQGDTDAGFQGEISHLHIWERPLRRGEIDSIKSGCDFPRQSYQAFSNDLLFKWSLYDRDIQTYESVSRIAQDACGRFTLNLS